MTMNPFYNQSELYEYAFFQSLSGKALLTLEGNFVEVNPSFCRMIGYTREELLQMSFRDITFPADLDLSSTVSQRIAEGTFATHQTVKRYIHKEGRLIWALIELSLLSDSDGKPLFIVSQAIDITEKKETEKQLQESEQKHRSLFENHPDLIFIVSLQGKLLSMNSSVADVLGWSEEELFQQQQFWGKESFAPGNYATYTLHFGWALQGDCQDFEVQAYHKDGSLQFLRIILIPMIIDGRMEGVYGIVKNITRFKENTQKLRKTEELYRLISENARDLIVFMSPDGTLRYISPSVKQLLGYTPEDVVGKPVTHFWHPDDVTYMRESNFLNKSEPSSLICRIQHQHGHYVWVETLITLLRNEEGELQKIIGVGRDITDRRNAEQDIMQREEIYRRLVEDSPDAIAISVNRQWTYVNNTLVKLLGGTSKEELIQIPSYSFVHPDYHDMNKSRITQVEEGHTADLAEQVLLKLNGEAFIAETFSIPTIYQGEKAVHTIIRDVSHRKKEQEHLVNSEKLSIAGQLAAGIAHEIRNPLTTIKGFIKLMKTSKKPEYIDIIAEEVERMEGIVTELLLLSKPKKEKFEKKNIVSALQQVVTLLKSQAHLKNIEIEASYAAEHIHIECDENQLKQAFINFLKNAIEAMPGGGVIQIHLTFADQVLKISFKDQGIGMPEDMLQKLGEPFVTTKESGTGLGFMVSKSIIVSHGGTLHVKSALGQGTTVEIEFPFAGEAS
ncbi:PAS domain S-box protein [Paenibacillus hexagrammi]|uniref:histidine kinase n=1 Tax=Paenibacillus hexagrammi TaxID=2908839 RepID=A0ABY3SK99_9BACL|nr:PAS domain S-box protein [Paenibacillus sp. YPD9-1]UJF33580.1 PAS domain S-box protein [Paenibacillus sp. YPD9-1]